MCAEILELQNWVDTIEVVDSGGEADTEKQLARVEWCWPGGAFSRRDRGDSPMYYVQCGSGGAV